MTSATTEIPLKGAAPAADAVDPASIGLRVRALRESMGLSLRDLAERSSVGAATLSQVERGESSPTLTVAARIAEGLELSLSQLLRIDETRHVVVVRRGAGRRSSRGGHEIEELPPRAAPATRRSTSPAAARRSS
jgi:XRE family transcriptional regulator, regulator of sulfur utilization